MPKHLDPREIHCIGANQRDRHPHPNDKVPALPKHENTMLLVASPGSGKTNFICDLLLYKYKGYFHDIYIASPTVDSDDKWEIVKKEKGLISENPHKSKLIQNDAPGKMKLEAAQPLESLSANSIFPHLNQTVKQTLRGAVVMKKDKNANFTGKIPEKNFVEKLEDLLPILKVKYDKIRELKNKFGLSKALIYSDRTLIIADDQAGLFNQSNHTNPIVNFYFKHRHHNCSVWTVTQAYKAIPKKIRTATQCLVLFEIGNQKELKDVYEDWQMNLREDEWMALYKHAVDQPFSFLFIDRKKPPGERIWMRFISPMKPASRVE